MSSEVFTLHATTCSDAVLSTTSAAITATTSGMMFLNSDLWSGFVLAGQTSNMIRVPKGCALKIWKSSVRAGIPATVSVMTSAASGNPVGSFTVVESQMVNGLSGVNTESTVRHSSRPIVIPSHDGKKVVKFQYETIDGANNVYADYDCEIVEIEK